MAGTYGIHYATYKEIYIAHRPTESSIIVVVPLFELHQFLNN